VKRFAVAVPNSKFRDGVVGRSVPVQRDVGDHGGLRRAGRRSAGLGAFVPAWRVRRQVRRPIRREHHAGRLPAQGAGGRRLLPGRPQLQAAAAPREEGVVVSTIAAFDHYRRNRHPEKSNKIL